MLGLALALLGASDAKIHAQQAAAPAAAAPAAAPAEGGEGKKSGKTLRQVWVEGGWVMYPLAACSIAMVALTAEGFFKLRIIKLAPPALVARAREMISQGDYQGLWEVCRANPCFFSTVLGAALERLGRGKDAVDAIIGEVSIKEGTLLKTRNTYLSVLGVVSPMIGLSGTVTGMIGAFAVLGQSGITDPAALSARISEVLIATAGGLLVAIPAFIFYYILRNRAQGVVIVADSEVNRLIQDVPFEELHGIKVGEGVAPQAPAAPQWQQPMAQAFPQPGAQQPGLPQPPQGFPMPPQGFPQQPGYPPQGGYPQQGGYPPQHQ